MKFRIKDRVILIKLNSDGKDDLEDSPANPLWNGQHGKIIGTIVEADSEVDYPYNVKWDNKEKGEYLEEELEFANTKEYKEIEKKEIRKQGTDSLKPGDRVVAIKGIGNCSPRKINVKGVVLNMDDESIFTVEFDENIEGHDGNGFAKPPGKNKHCWNFTKSDEPGEYLRLIEESIKTIGKEEFKIGDKIRFKNYTLHEDWKEHKGETATISISDDTIPYPIQVVWEDLSTSRTTKENLIKIYDTIINEKEEQKVSEDRKGKVKKVHVVDVIRHGKQLIIPPGMNYDDAITALQRKKEYEEQTIEIFEDIDTFVWDGAIALQKAMEQLYGWSTAETEEVKSFFGTMKFPPKMIQIECGINEKISVPWGKFSLPGIEGHLETGAGKKKGRLIFSVKATVKRKHKEAISELVELARQFVKEHSIYRGKAIKMEFFNEHGDRQEMPTPSFIDVSKVEEKDIVFSETVNQNINGNLYTPIINAKICKEHKVPLKRGILLSGPYGTGKTLVANVTAKRCVEYGWTFLMCEQAEEIADMVDFAHQYQPAVVFCEDIDRVLDGERDIKMDDILNIIDGIESKNTEIIIVLTTNHVEKIHKSMLRPGRLDAIINVLPPDAIAVEKLIRIYGRGLIADTEDLTEVGKMLENTIPAVIRECVERSKLYAIHHNGHGKLAITSKDLLGAADSMKHQLELLYGTKEEKDEKLLVAKKIADFLFGNQPEQLEKIIGELKIIRNQTC